MSEYEGIRGFRVRYVSSDPTLDSGSTGDVWYNSTTGVNKTLILRKSTAAADNLNTARSGIAAAGQGPSTLSIAFGGTSAHPNTDTTATEEYTGFSWFTTASLNGDRTYMAGFGTSTAAVGAGGYKFSTGNQALVEEFDGSSWTEVNNLPAVNRSQAAAGTLTAGLVFGGTPATDTTLEYDGTNWTSGGALNTGRKYLAGCEIQTAALAAGGSDGTPTRSSATEEYDGSSWTSANSFSTGRSAVAGFGTQTQAVIAGGASPSIVNSIEEYDGTNWITSPATLATARSYLAGFGSGTAGVLCGGNTPPVSALTENYTSSINVETTGSFTAGGNLSSVARSTATVVGTSTTSMLYLGGYRGPTPSPPSFQGQVKAESYNGTSWTAITDMPRGMISGFGAGTTTAALLAAGNDGSTQYQTPIVNSSLEWNGSSWTNGGNTPQTQNLGASAGTQTAGFLWAGKTGTPSTSTTVSAEYDGSSFTTGGSLPHTAVRHMGTGTQTAAFSFGGHTSTPGSPSEDLALTDIYNGSSWTSGPTLSMARNAAAGAGTTSMAILMGGYKYEPGAQNVSATEWYDGTSWANITNNIVDGPGTFSGPSGSAATDALFQNGSNPGFMTEWTGQPATTATASTLTTS